MRYSTITLDIDKETARERISERVRNVRTKTEQGRVEYTTNAGLVLAVLTDAKLPSGDQGSKLRYRTAIISTHHSHAKETARKIRDAVESYRV